MANEIVITCNGSSQSLERDSTIGKLLVLKKVDPACVVVELNKDIVQKESFNSIPLRDKDTVEILHFVGGG
jgi:sulfur carrier protein